MILWDSSAYGVQRLGRCGSTGWDLPALVYSVASRGHIDYYT
jgi:hypothetical protein